MRFTMKPVLNLTLLGASLSTTALALAPAPNPNEKIERFRFEAAQIRSAELHNAAGNIRIAPTTSKTAHLAVNKRRWGPRCKLDVELKVGRLKVDLTDKSWILDQECRADFILSLPQGANVSAQTGSGDILMTEQRGQVAAKVGSGIIDIKGELKSFRALSGSGSVRLDGFTEKAEVRAGSGDIDFFLSRKPAKGDLALVTGTGNVDIDVPDDTEVLAKTVTGNGTVTNSFKDSAKPQISVKAKSGKGNISIH
jgi:DUF4097 and DUF4098 domain-containing protein YvlB